MHYIPAIVIGIEENNPAVSGSVVQVWEQWLGWAGLWLCGHSTVSQHVAFTINREALLWSLAGPHFELSIYRKKTKVHSDCWLSGLDSSGKDQ